MQIVGRSGWPGRFRSHSISSGYGQDLRASEKRWRRGGLGHPISGSHSSHRPGASRRGEAVMSISFCPRLAQAANLLPGLRAHLVAAASRHMLPDGFSFDLLPIVEDGVFGYEFLPQRQTHTYLTVGCDSGGRPVLRKSLYCAEAPSALRLGHDQRARAHAERARRLASNPVARFLVSGLALRGGSRLARFRGVVPGRAAAAGPLPRRTAQLPGRGVGQGALAPRRVGSAHRFLRGAGRGAIRHRVDGCQRRIGTVDGANGGPLDVAMGRRRERPPRGLGRGGAGRGKRHCLGLCRDDAMQRSVLAMPFVCRRLGLRVPAVLDGAAARERAMVSSGGSR